MKRIILNSLLFLGAPFTFISSAWLWFVKKAGTGKINDRIFMNIGVLPVLDQYYEPMINPRKYIKKSLRDDRELKGIDFNTEEQLGLLAKFKYNDELLKFPITKKKEMEFYYDNPGYRSGDAESLYNIIRHFKPRRIIEIGSGNSTLMARNAIEANKREDAAYTCQHICIEPYEMPWLEKSGVEVIREKVEDIDKSFFENLGENDILFIDSSHIIRPQGDVLCEYLEILPILKSGVIIHIHDIFSPKDYLSEWVLDYHNFWNEQYLLEAFLFYNSEFKIIAALNYLSHQYKSQFAAKNPIYAKQPGREPGSFWIQRK